jgi:pyruvate,water dikinase
MHVILKGNTLVFVDRDLPDHPDFAKWLMDKGIASISLNPDTVVKTWENLSK